MSDTVNPTAGAATNGTAPAGQMQQQASTTDTGTNPTTTPPAQAPDTDEAAQATTRTYSQEEYQRMSTSQYKAGIVAVMKEAGFEPEKGAEFQAQMKAFREWQDAQKSDLERATDASGKLQAALDTEKARADLLERRVAALGKGVPADKIDDYISLAVARMKDDVAFEAALENALAAFPIAKASESLPKVVAPAQKQTEEKAAYRPPNVI